MKEFSCRAVACLVWRLCQTVGGLISIAVSVHHKPNYRMSGSAMVRCGIILLAERRDWAGFDE